MDDLGFNNQLSDECWFAVYKNKSTALDVTALFLETSAT